MSTPSHKAKKEKKSKALDPTAAVSTPIPAAASHPKSKSKSKSKSKPKSKFQPVEEKVATTHDHDDDDDDVQFDVDNDTDEPVVVMEEEAPIEEDEEDDTSDEETPTTTKPTLAISTDTKNTKSDPFILVIQLCRTLSTYTPTTPSSSLLTPLSTLHHISSHPPSNLTLSSTNAKELQSIWKTIDASKPHDTSNILIQDAVASLPIDTPFLLTCLTRRLTSLIHSRLSIPPTTSSSASFHDLYVSFITDSFAFEWEALRGDDGMDARRVDVLADGIRHSSDIYTAFEREMHIEGFRQALARKKRVKAQTTNTSASIAAPTSKPVPTHDKADVTGEDLIEQEDDDMTQKTDKKSKKNKDDATKKKKKDKTETATATATNEEKPSKKHKAIEQNGVEHKKSKKQKH